MTQPDRITLVLRACEAAPLSSILPFVKLGELVSVGRGLAVITAASQGDLVSPALEREAFNLDEHVRMAADARRYRWLRDQALSTDSGHTPAVFDRAGGIGTLRVGVDLDQRIDAAIRHLTTQHVVQERQP
ncbi:hypothetical protein JIQ88_01320 [Pseudomonas sp. PCH44]|uniref:hypothetical protein n=1 Tax=Pseudomonas sp. PCH44 TaxID=2800904 RepID=UPI001BAF1553|nr:hypothetical protein [Pseudomonas sp. PCH44]MBS3183719.1 hypothetical protein [Pseudomonas sp. PCH44]